MYSAWQLALECDEGPIYEVIGSRCSAHQEALQGDVSFDSHDSLSESECSSPHDTAAHRHASISISGVPLAKERVLHFEVAVDIDEETSQATATERVISTSGTLSESQNPAVEKEGEEDSIMLDSGYLAFNRSGDEHNDIDIMMTSTTSPERYGYERNDMIGTSHPKAFSPGGTVASIILSAVDSRPCQMDLRGKKGVHRYEYAVTTVTATMPSAQSAAMTDSHVSDEISSLSAKRQGVYEYESVSVPTTQPLSSSDMAI